MQALAAAAAKALLVLAALLGGGACAAPFRCPAAGGPAWSELVSEHFTLATDLDHDDAEVAVRDLEEYRAALLTTLFRDGGDPGGKLRVVILSRERDWRVFEKERDGVFTESLFLPFIAMRASASDRTRVTIRHELTHYLSRRRIPRQPEWLSEGLATFFETMLYDRERGELLIGLPLPNRTAALRGGFSVSQAMTDPRAGQDRDRFYATSWLIVHTLISRHRERFSRYLGALERGQSGESGAQPWQDAFGPLGIAELQAEARNHLTGSAPLVESRPFRAPSFTIRTRPLDDASVHAHRALLALGGRGVQAPPEARELARAEIREALAGDPANLLALAVQAVALELPVDLEVARATTRRYPDDWLAWSVLYRAAGADLHIEESRRAAATAARLAATGAGLSLPLGPVSAVWSSAPLAESARCRAEPAARAAARECVPPRSPGARPPEEAARFQMIAGSDAAWCLFEHAGVPIVEATMQIAEDGRPLSVCAVGARVDDPTAACVQRALGALRFPAAPARCPASLRFELTLGPDGRLTVYPR